MSGSLTISVSKGVRIPLHAKVGSPAVDVCGQFSEKMTRRIILAILLHDLFRNRATVTTFRTFHKRTLCALSHKVNRFVKKLEGTFNLEVHHSRFLKGSST